MTHRSPSRSIVIVGGGVAGVLFAIQLLRGAEGPLTVTILEPRPRLGAGVAYSGNEPFHVTNVPAASMSLDPDDPGAFVRWLDRHGDRSEGGERDAYPRRWLFGTYVGELLQAVSSSRPDVGLIHLRQHAREITRTAAGLVVRTDADVLPADAVVLATGNSTPPLPGVLEPVAGWPRCVADPWAPRAFAGLPGDARVLVVGTGLTMGDTVAALRASGHRGEIVAMSRRGQVPRRGLATAVEPFGDFRQSPSTALGLLRLFRAEVRRAGVAGASWYAVLAAARREGWSLWAALPQAEQRRFVRHLRLFYEVHRHVMAGPVHDMVADECRRGDLQVVAGRLKRARLTGSALEVEIQPRGGGPASVRLVIFGAVVNCTGPAYAALSRTDPLWASMTHRGLVRADAVGLGPDADRRGRAVGADGTAQPDLLLVGTLARSAFGELTGVREIAAEARLAAEGLLATWKQHRAPGDFEAATDARREHAAAEDRVHVAQEQIA